MRHRIEDLGRLAILLDSICEDHFFDEPVRPKDYVEWFDKRTPEVKADILWQLAHGRQRIKEALAECVLIARGQDDLAEDTK